MEQLA
jgi:hypothetical protein